MDRHFRGIARGAVTAAARRISRNGRVVKDLPEWAGFGNQLFFHLWADTQQQRGVDFRLVRSERSLPWFEHFPLLASRLTISKEQVRLADRRDLTSWADISAIDAPSTASREDVHRFICTYLMPSGIFAPDDELSRGLTLNVRRGDYFSDPEVRGLFSFDQIAYIDVVVGSLCAQGRRPEQIRVVSDDLAWCRARLGHLEDATDSLCFVESDGPLGDLHTVACSRELIIMNSSFSIWAAWISAYLYGDNHDLIHAPAFGTRPFDGTVWRSLDPRWDIVPSIPGGWDS